MKALLRLDGYCIWSQFKLFLVVIFLYGIGALLSRQATFLLFSILFFCMIPYYLMQLTQGKFCLLLPCTRRQIVQERYLSLLLLIPPILVLLLLARLIVGPDSLPLLLFQLSSCLLIQGILIPLFYKFGAAKARLLLILTMGCFFGSSAALAAFAGESISFAFSGHLTLVAVAVLFLTLAVLWVSYRISLAIYEKQEF